MIPAAVWVASSGLCLRISSITLSSVSLSALGVDGVAATAAGSTGLRGGGAARWRGAGSSGRQRRGGCQAQQLAGFCFGARRWPIWGRRCARSVVASASGILALAQASVARADNPTARARPIAISDAGSTAWPSIARREFEQRRHGVPSQQINRSRKNMMTIVNIPEWLTYYAGHRGKMTAHADDVNTATAADAITDLARGQQPRIHCEQRPHGCG